MSKRNKITITFRLPIDVAERFEKIAKAEGKTHDQLFQDMLTLYVGVKARN